MSEQTNYSEAAQTPHRFSQDQAGPEQTKTPFCTPNTAGWHPIRVEVRKLRTSGALQAMLICVVWLDLVV